MKNPCADKTPRCINCHDLFSAIRPNIKEVIVTHHFKKDCQNWDEIAKNIVDCSHNHFTELHKFEEHLGEFSIFRAKKEKEHFVYAVDKSNRLILLRVFKNFSTYQKFLSDKKEIKKIL
jgi:hypothetical protein